MSLDTTTERNAVQLKVKKLRPDAVMPRYATPGAACFDLHADIANEHAIGPGETITIATSLAVDVPTGHVLLIFSRSGHGFKNDVRLANCVGVIDSDYRGELMVKLRNDQAPQDTFGLDVKVPGYPTWLRIATGDRIAQAMLVPTPKVELVEVDELSDTERGTGGFGSTGA